MKKMRIFYKILLTVFTISLYHTSLYAQWVQQPLPINKPITGIKFINSQTGWACTSRGTPADTGYIIATTNSGTNWFVQISAFNYAFTDINALDNLTCFASAYDAVINRDKIYKTSDGGQNWTVITMVPNMGIDDMQFLNKDSAWECGTSVGPDVRTTTDGGNTWIVRTNGISNQTDKVFFLNYNTGFCAGGFFLYKTTDLGLNWFVISSFSDRIFGILFKDASTGWLTMAGHNIASTTNGGLNWTVQNIFGRSENIYDIVMFQNTGWASTAWTGRILKTTNGGINWGYQLVTIGSVNLSFTDTSNGWCGQFAMSHTTNGGGNITFSGIQQIGSEIPESFKLHQNYPNPFNPVTSIIIDLPEKASVLLMICDVTGRKLAELENDIYPAGTYKYTWNAEKYSSGVYLCRIIANNYTDTKKLILIK